MQAFWYIHILQIHQFALFNNRSIRVISYAEESQWTLHESTTFYIQMLKPKFSSHHLS